MTNPLTIVFVLFPGITQLDFTGPFEMLKRLPGARVVVASRDGGTLKADSGLEFAGLSRLDEVAIADVICVPGGSGMTEALADAELIAAVRRLGQDARYVTSVCTGSLLLAAAGLLDGKRATCHWAFRPLLAELGVQVENARVVRDGNVITGGGVTAGIDFALTLVAELAGPEVAQRIQLYTEYDPQPPFAAGSPDRAPAELVALVREQTAKVVADRRAALLAARAKL
ncbi:DJ-1/PfpI family protein [Sorangium sp. So ce887]|uniref:DJ-1/PfpI family protein n=1 Tax=Sorangium sp. So ce887 TaxID=3133324 RepID=UPI003F5F4CD0